MSAQPVTDVLPIVSKPSATFVAVTPETAERWLELNFKNRNLRKADVNRYARDMKAGRWHLDGSPIRFASDGSLLDGQHRLAAIIKADVTLNLLVVRGVSPAAQAVMDTGRKRTAADVLAINGHRNYTLIAAAARLGVNVADDDVSQNNGVSHPEILAYLDENPDIVSAAEFVAPIARRTNCSPSVVAYSYMIMRRISPQDAAEFWMRVAEGVGLDRSAPELVLRERLAEALRSRERLSRDVLLSMIFRAWNARREGRTIQVLRIKSPGSKGGLIPIPKPI